MHLKIVTIDQTIFDGEITALLTRSGAGEFMILPDHAPMIALTVPTPTLVTLPGNVKKTLYTAGGVLKVLENDLLFITDQAIWQEQIDLAAARAELIQLQSDLKDPDHPDPDSVRRALAQVKARIRTAEAQ